MSSFSNILPVVQAVAPLASGLLSAGAPSAPAASAAPAAPAAVAPPPAPEVSSAPEVKREEPVVDTEAARIRAQKRRKAAEDRRLFALSEEDSDAVVLTKSLLGE